MSFFMATKKQFDISSLQSELSGQSVFFKRDPANEAAAPVAQEVSPPPLPALPIVPAKAVPDTVIPRHRDTVIPPTAETIIEITRRAVKQLGKEAATHRFTGEEKKALRAIQRDYEERDIRTTENELTRIAINYLIEDYKRNGQQSILAQTLSLINS